MSNTTTPQTIEQQRAAFAYQLVTQHKQNKHIKGYSRNLPGMILTNGFGQAMAFCLSKSGKGKNNSNEEQAYAALQQGIFEWLGPEQQQLLNGGSDIVAAITELDQHRYQLATAEALALCKWIKQLATALIEDTKNTDQPNF